VQWTPTAAQLGLQDVTLTVTDGRGGTATQTYQVSVAQAVGNHPPIIISDPVTQFNIPSGNHPASGDVDPTGIVLNLAPGQTSDQTVSFGLGLPHGTPLTLGSTVSGTLTTAGQQSSSSF